MAVSRTITMTTLALSYDAIAAKLGIAVPSARRLVHRKKWPKSKGNDGRAVVQVPAEFFDAHHDGPSDKQHDGLTDGQKDDPQDDSKAVIVTEGALSEVLARLAAAQTELVEMARRLGAAESEAAALRADRDRWAAQTDKLATRRSWWPWRRSA